MLEVFGWQVSGATLAVVLGWVVTGGVQTFRLGSKIERAKANAEQLRREVDDLKSASHAQRQNMDAQHASLSGGLAILRDQAAEFRHVVADRYATRDSVEALERRLTANQDRILDRLDQISGRLEQLGSDLVKALGNGRAA